MLALVLVLCFCFSVVVVETAAPQDSGVLVGIRLVFHRYVMYMSISLSKKFWWHILIYCNIQSIICSTHIYTRLEYSRGKLQLTQTLFDGIFGRSKDKVRRVVVSTLHILR